MLSHDNILYDARVIIDSIGVKNGSEVVVSFLPLSHVAAQVKIIFTKITILK